MPRTRRKHQVLVLPTSLFTFKHVASACKSTTFIIFNRSFGAPDDDDEDEGEDEDAAPAAAKPKPKAKPKGGD